MPHYIHITLSFQQYFMHSKHTKQKHWKKILDSKVFRKLQKHRTKNARARSLQEHVCASIRLFPLLKQLQLRELFNPEKPTDTCFLLI